MGSTAVTMSAFQDDRIFPFKRRSTAFNIIVFVCNAVTIGAPFVNEEEEPVPMIVIIAISSLQLLIVFFFKDKSELD